jgi:hypothetical protein
MQAPQRRDQLGSHSGHQVGMPRRPHWAVGALGLYESSSPTGTKVANTPRKIAVDRTVAPLMPMRPRIQSLGNLIRLVSSKLARVGRPEQPDQQGQDHGVSSRIDPQPRFRHAPPTPADEPPWSNAKGRGKRERERQPNHVAYLLLSHGTETARACPVRRTSTTNRTGVLADGQRFRSEPTVAAHSGIDR